MSARKKKFLLSASVWRNLSHVFISGAFISILLATLGYLRTDIWLASTQWLLVAGVLAAFGVYSRLES
ncbi:hypothetical protein A3A70_01360 [candidate division WWE3 bacterium RIFCSPLOWO2_01_FULL_42_11]|uniref:Uncharacterized protein n=1 Tax=candidate division WWE3 bacterium RIFCSPLOWO2_01_FULL_42_11 TaxID=1802627 RepID=A0A1F4VQQ1_UNCKA|nr:MAG: hypothetical protein A3A70_01360 [candidate division WWE3 bacterium RIFCSPLOWO2_01_FULL_42_11]